MEFEQAEIDEGVRGVMAYLGMIDAPQQTIPDDQIYTRSTWVRASLDQNGFFFTVTQLGDVVKEGELLGRIVDPVTDFEHEIRATRDGTLIGRAVSRPVLNGYGLFHIAWVE